MNYGGIIKNDFSAAPGVCLTMFVQGCGIHCPGCHNPELQDFEGGRKYNFDVQREIVEGLTANGIHRSFCIMGGEPLATQNRGFTKYLIKMVQTKVPNTKVYVWTGYIYESLVDLSQYDKNLKTILESADFLVDGPYIECKRDITLAMRGSRNQRVIDLKTGEIVLGEKQEEKKKQTTNYIILRHPSRIEAFERAYPHFTPLRRSRQCGNIYVDQDNCIWKEVLIGGHFRGYRCDRAIVDSTIDDDTYAIQVAPIVIGNDINFF